MWQDLRSIEGNLVAIFGEEARDFSKLDQLSQEVFDDIFAHINDLWYTQKNGEVFGEFDLRSSFSAFRVAFILVSNHWSALVAALNLWDVAATVDTEKKDLIPLKEICRIFEATMPEELFKDMVQIGEKRFGKNGGLASAILELAIWGPIVNLKQALDVFGSRDYNPVRFMDPVELFKEKEDHNSDYCNRINNNIFLEINPYTPITIIESELHRLITHIKERQKKFKKEDEKEAATFGGRPEYYDWDHERKSNGVAKEKSLLKNGLLYLETYGLKHENPKLPLQDLAKLWHEEVYGKAAPPEQLDSIRKAFGRWLTEAEKHVFAALFGNFPPVS
jgi:hypothetical protein